MKAFPILTSKTNEDGKVYPFVEEGMDLRDYFAAKAMQARLNAVYSNDKQMEFILDVCEDEGISMQEEISNCAYSIADAMMEARK